MCIFYVYIQLVKCSLYVVILYYRIIQASPFRNAKRPLFSFSRANGPGNGTRWDQAKARNTMGFRVYLINIYYNEYMYNHIYIYIIIYV